MIETFSNPDFFSANDISDQSQESGSKIDFSHPLDYSEQKETGRRDTGSSAYFDTSRPMDYSSRETQSMPEDKDSGMTQKEKNNRQDTIIDDVQSGKRKLEDSQEKGNFGEMKVDQDMRNKGYERISNDSVTSLDSPIHQGIDGVYYNPDGHPPYVIVDAKYGSSELKDTNDGRQMSQNWIDNRLDSSVGKEKADDIRMEKLVDPDNVGSYVGHVDEKGNVSYDRLDDNANVVEKGARINA